MKEKPGSTLKYCLQRAGESLKDTEILFDGGGSSRNIVDLSYDVLFYSAQALFHRGTGAARGHTGSPADVLSRFDMEYVRTGVFPGGMSRLYHHVHDLKEARESMGDESITNEESIDILNGVREFLGRVRAHIKFLEKQNHISQLYRFLEVVRGKFSVESFGR